MAGMSRGVVWIVAFAAVLTWPRAASARTPSTTPPDHVVLAGDVVVPQGTVVGEVVVFSGSATIAGVAQGDVVVLDGPITIGGQVGGDVVAVHGPVRLLETAQVSGDVLVGGRYTADPDAEVSGEVRTDVSFTLAEPSAVLGALLAGVAVSASILLAGLLLLLLAPRGLERAAEAGREAPLASVGWGIVLAIAIPGIAIAAVASVLGLPLGLATLLGVGLLWLLAQTVAVWFVGRLLVRAPRSRLGALAAGWGLSAAVGLVPVLNLVWWILGAIFGLGIATVAIWRARTGPRVAVKGRRGGAHRARRAGAPPPSEVPVAAPAGAAGGQRPADMPLAED
jgi:hypothetical protein